MNLTIGQLRKIAIGPSSDSNMASIVAGWTAYGPRCGLDRPHRLALYVAELAHESGDFRYDHELWGPTPAQARYDTRTELGNSPQVDGDGKLYEGRTGIQVTGKANYQAFRDWCRAEGFRCPDFVADPEAIDTDPWEGLAPIWFWVTHGLNAIADTGDIAAVTRRINGGENGEADRVVFYVRSALVLLGFGPTDVKGFQKSQLELTPDGDAGPKTLAALHESLVALEAPVPSQRQAAPPAAAYLQAPPVLATPAVVKASLKSAGSETIASADNINKILAGGGTAVAGVTMVSQLTDAVSAVPPLVWGLLLVAGILGVYLFTHRIVLARIETALTGLNTEIPVVRPNPIQPLPIEETPAAAATPEAPAA